MKHCVFSYRLGAWHKFVISSPGSASCGFVFCEHLGHREHPSQQQCVCVCARVCVCVRVVCDVGAFGGSQMLKAIESQKLEALFRAACAPSKAAAPRIDKVSGHPVDTPHAVLGFPWEVCWHRCLQVTSGVPSWRHSEAAARRPTRLLWDACVPCPGAS